MGVNINKITMKIIELFKRKIYKQINRYVSHKSSIKAFDKYIDEFGNNQEKI